MDRAFLAKVMETSFLLGDSLAAKKLAKAATEVAKLVLDTIKVFTITSKQVVALNDNLFPLLLAWYDKRRSGQKRW